MESGCDHTDGAWQKDKSFFRQYIVDDKESPQCFPIILDKSYIRIICDITLIAGKVGYTVFIIIIVVAGNQVMKKKTLQYRNAKWDLREFKLGLGLFIVHGQMLTVKMFCHEIKGKNQFQDSLHILKTL